MSIRELIDRMYHGDFHSAREEAGKLADLGALEEIRTILEQSKDTPEKKFCYWILGDLGRNTQAPEVMDYLIERVPREKTVTLRKLALQKISFLHGASDPQNIIVAAQDKNRDVRLAAIAALGACTDPRAEQALIAIVAASGVETGGVEMGGVEMGAVREAAIALARIGTERCAESTVGLIRRLPRNRAYEVALAASLLTLSRIGSSAALPLAVEELGQSRQPFPNWASMLVIEHAGNEHQIDLVIERLTKLLKKKNRHDLAFCITMLETEYEDELAAGSIFLQQFDDPRVQQFVAFLHDKAPSLHDREKNFLARHIAGFEQYRTEDNDGKWLAIG